MLTFEWPFDPDDVIVPQWGEFGKRPRGLVVVAHDGIDLNAPHGATVRAAAAGVVTLIRVEGDGDDGEGNAVWIKHTERFMTRYLHLQAALLVRAGEFVELGQPLGKVGQSGNADGPHLCFMTLIEGAAFNPRTFMRNRAKELQEATRGDRTTQ